jgi:hypothetical protein
MNKRNDDIFSLRDGAYQLVRVEGKNSLLEQMRETYDCLGCFFSIGPLPHPSDGWVSWLVISCTPLAFEIEQFVRWNRV